jgi:2,3-dihydroxybenzoate-AMP ligase
VVVQLPNVPEFVYTYLALVRIGAIPVMALRAHRHAEVTHFLRASGAVAYVIPDAIRDFDYRAMAAEVAPTCPALRMVIVAGNPGPGQHALSTLLEFAGGDATDLASLCTDPSEVSRCCCRVAQLRCPS